MQTIILTLHVIVCIVLIVLVLLQAGREGMGVIFGGGGNSSVFGSTGAGGVLVKLTTFLAVLFIATSLGYNLRVLPLWIFSSRKFRPPKRKLRVYPHLLLHRKPLPLLNRLQTPHRLPLPDFQDILLEKKAA